MPAAIWALGFVSLLMDISSEAIHSLLPGFLFTFVGASAFAIGLIDGAATAIALVARMASGRLADRWRRKPVALAGYALSAASKPLFVWASGVGTVMLAKGIDRVGKGVRGAARDALVADLAPADAGGAAFGLRQALDSAGAVIGPLLALLGLWLLAGDYRAVFAFAAVPALGAVLLLAVGVSEPERRGATGAPAGPSLGRGLWRAIGAEARRVIALGAVITLARFSESFLVLRALDGGLAPTLAPLVWVGLNAVYAAASYPAGRWADRAPRSQVLGIGLLALLAADLVLALSAAPVALTVGVALWGLHLALTQGVLAAGVAQVAPPAWRGSAFGLFHLASGAAALVAGAVAGGLWDRVGPSATFVAGAVAVLAALALLARSARSLR